MSEHKKQEGVRAGIKSAGRRVDRIVMARWVYKHGEMPKGPRDETRAEFKARKKKWTKEQTRGHHISEKREAKHLIREAFGVRGRQYVRVRKAIKREQRAKQNEAKVAA